MSFLKRLFGGGGTGDDGGESEGKPVGSALDYNGFTIRATPYKADGAVPGPAGCRTRRRSAGNSKEHRFVRADRFASQNEAADMALKKGQQIVNEQGDRMFS